MTELFVTPPLLAGQVTNNSFHFIRALSLAHLHSTAHQRISSRHLLDHSYGILRLLQHAD